MPESEEEACKVDIIRSEAAIWQSEWIRAEVFQERCLFQTSDPAKYLSFRDFVQGTFSVLEHTPVTAFGFNIHHHYRLEDRGTWHAIGNKYAPKEAWNDILIDPGTRALVMEGKRAECDADRIQIRLEPSGQIEYGVQISTNEHYQLDKEESGQQTPMLRMLELLNSGWNSFLEYGLRASRALVSQGIGER